MRNIALALALALFQVRAPASGLDDIRDIDIVRVVHSTGQVYLYLVLDPDQLATRPEVREKIFRKLQAYRYYVVSGQVWESEAGSNPKLPVVLTVVVTGIRNAEVELALGEFKSEFESGTTAYAVEYSPHKPNGSSKQ